jgi:hypothetical protein
MLSFIAFAALSRKKALIVEPKRGWARWSSILVHFSRSGRNSSSH